MTNKHIGSGRSRDVAGGAGNGDETGAKAGKQNRARPVRASMPEDRPATSRPSEPEYLALLFPQLSEDSRSAIADLLEMHERRGALAALASVVEAVQDIAAADDPQHRPERPEPPAHVAAPSVAPDLGWRNAVEFILRRLVLAQARGAPDPEAAMAAWVASIDHQVTSLDRVLAEVAITEPAMREIVAGQGELTRLRDEVVEEFRNDH